METFVAGIFATKEQASEGARGIAGLAAQGGCRLESLGVYARNVLGEFALEASIDTASDLAFADSGAGQEALNELNERAPDGTHVLLLHLIENDPAPTDATLRSYGATTVLRRSTSELDSSGARRFTEY